MSLDYVTFGCIRFEATALRHCAQPHS